MNWWRSNPDRSLQRLQSWGRYPQVEQYAHALSGRSEPLPVARGGTLLPRGQGRSYGDCCLNAGGTLLMTEGLEELLDFDTSTGVLRCEAGITLGRLLEKVVPEGWFLPVLPGTRFVSVGGAIANDVHGKNHHHAGTFGRHVRRFELLRSNGQRLLCSPSENSDWYAATVGGLGLTGLIVWAEVQLRRIHNPYMLVETLPFRGLEEFFERSLASDRSHEYTVAWVDCLARGPRLGRGLLFRGNHAPALPETRRSLPRAPSRARGLSVPCELPSFALHPLWVRAFNSLYFHLHSRRPGSRLTHYAPFFFPLDGLRHWNRLYGRRGLLQFQCVVPPEHGRHAMRRLLERVANSQQGSSLAVLKVFGDTASPGLMSFPRPGVTLALDFPNRGEPTWRLLAELERMTGEYGGALYPAKDSRMTPGSFAASFPQREAFPRYVDPAFSSSFWRRVGGGQQVDTP